MRGTTSCAGTPAVTSRTRSGEVPWRPVRAIAVARTAAQIASWCEANPMPIWRVFDSVSTGIVAYMVPSICSRGANPEGARRSGTFFDARRGRVSVRQQVCYLEHPVFLQATVNGPPGDPERARGRFLVVLVERQGAEDEVLLYVRQPGYGSASGRGDGGRGSASCTGSACSCW